MNAGNLYDFAHINYHYPKTFLSPAFLQNAVRSPFFSNISSRSGRFPSESLVYQGSHNFLQNAARDCKGRQAKQTNSVDKYLTPSRVGKTTLQVLRPRDLPPAYSTLGVPADINKVLCKPVEQEMYSRKVFIGGLPIDIREDDVYNTFRLFGKVLVDWPRRQDKAKEGGRYMVGYVFLVFDEEASVRRLVQACHEHADKLYLFVSSPTMRDKPVQVRPWKLSDANYKRADDLPMDNRYTVFIGGVPRPTKAVDLAGVLNREFGIVSYVGVDTDPELNYPKGCARVTFADAKTYIAAISGRYIYLNHIECEKRVEIKPYLVEDQMCDECGGKKCHGHYAPYFCGHENCLQYYCENCWDALHEGAWSSHCPIARVGDQTKVFQRAPHQQNNGSRMRSSGRYPFVRG